jgi:hypothetical protein
LLALAAMPATNVALLFSEYKLHAVPSRALSVLALGAALVLSVAWAATQARSLRFKVLLAVAFLAWAGLSYLVTVFLPGCIWASACL